MLGVVSLQVGLVSFCCVLRVGSFVYFLYALRLLAVLYISFAYQKKKKKASMLLSKLHWFS